MAKLDPNALAQSALKAISERAGIKDAVLAHSAEDVVPSTGKKIFLFAATEKGKPNSRSATVVLDESGAAVDLAKLSASEARAFFTPVIRGVSPEILEGRRVKIDPAKNDLKLEECDRFTETVTVTIPKEGAFSKADVYFLADTTDSMRFILAAVRAGASQILTDLDGPIADLACGVGNYKDFPFDSQAFVNQQSITTNLALVQTAIGAWSNSGGFDIAEGQFFGLDKLAEPPGGPIGWRTGSKRIIVWFGDAPGHDPICKAISSLLYDITEASVTNKLVAEKISVIAISTTSGSAANALDGDPVATSTDYGVCGAPGGAPGQATRIANVTGGRHVLGIDPTTIVPTIIDLIRAVVSFTANVNLVPDPVIAPFVTSITPAGGYGPLGGDKDHVLKFEVTFAPGDAHCTTRDQVFNGFLNVVADRVVVARKPTRITIPACKFTYSVKFICGVQPECECACAPVRPGAYATEINIHNYKCRDAEIEKWFIPVVLAGAVIGREPKVVKRRVVDRLRLPADSATMDDCCRITELLLGAAPTSPTPLTIGFLEIVSNVELNVTAVYTATDLKSNGLSIDVVNVDSRLK